MANDSHIQGVNPSHASSQAAQTEAAAEVEAEVLGLERSMIECGENALFPPMYVFKDSEKLEKRVTAQTVNEAEAEEHDFEQLVDDVTKMAKSFEKKNS
jgi:hypothetical protein